jgi:hypothetical protein
MDDVINRILRDSRTIAVVGCSANPAKAAHSVPADMQRAGYTVLPVNPNADRVLGVPAYPDLAAVPDRIDLVNVFRPAADAPAVAAAAARAGAKALWLQLGIRSAEAARIAAEAGMDYVEDACIAVERLRRGITRTG